MKTIHHIFLLSILCLFVSCEDVVDVDLDTAAPRLVVDASINWVKGTDGGEQRIRLTKTAGYYNNEVPAVSGAVVFVTNSSGTVFSFAEDEGTGYYICTNFVPVIEETYTLTVHYEDETYTAVETLKSVPDIGTVEQDNEGGFFNDEIEVKFFYQDNPLADNYYQVRYNASVLAFPNYEVFSDEYTQGNESFDFFSHEDLAPGDDVDIKFYGISRRYYEYMNKLLAVAGNNGGGPFGTTPAKVRGNLRDPNDAEGYALGYFRLSEVDTLVYTVQ